MYETAKADIFIAGMVHGAMVCEFLAIYAATLNRSPAASPVCKRINWGAITISKDLLAQRDGFGNRPIDYIGYLNEKLPSFDTGGRCLFLQELA
jgi:hypothetical protein